MSLPAVAFSMRPPKYSGPDTTGSGADRVEEGDAQRPCLHREHLTGGEVGRAGTRRGEEEDDHARRREGDGGEGMEVEAGDGEEDAGHDVGGGDHANPADGVEQRGQGQGAEEVAGGECGDVPAHRLDPEEGAEGVPEGEEERVVEERLADEEGEAQDGASGVRREDGLRDQGQPYGVTLPDGDRLAGRLEPVAALLLDG